MCLLTRLGRERNKIIRAAMKVGEISKKLYLWEIVGRM